MAKLTKEQKQELYCWTIQVVPLWDVGDNGKGVLGSVKWSTEIYRGTYLMGAHGLGTFDEAYKRAMSLKYRRYQSPFPDLRPIPPSQVGIFLSHQFLKQHHNDLVELFEGQVQHG